MTNRLMMSVAAAALIAGTSFAYAQGTEKGHEGPAAGAAVEHGLEHGAPSGAPAKAVGHESAQTSAPSAGMKAAQSEPKAPEPKAAGAGQRAEGNMQGRKPEGMAAESREGRPDMKAEGREDRNGMKAEKGEDRKEMKAEGREDRNGVKAEKGEDRKEMKAEGREDRNGMKAEGREDRNGVKAEGKGPEENRSETVGQAGAGGVRLSTEQRTKITTVIRDEHVAPVTNVNFSISVGAHVPREVEFHPLPERIISIYPDWRGYDFILVRDEILVVNPRTLEIVAILET